MFIRESHTVACGQSKKLQLMNTINDEADRLSKEGQQTADAAPGLDTDG